MEGTERNKAFPSVLMLSEWMAGLREEDRGALGTGITDPLIGPREISRRDGELKSANSIYIYIYIYTHTHTVLEPFP